MQNWLKGDDISRLEVEPTINELEFYENVEEGCCSYKFVTPLQFSFSSLT